MRLYRSSVRLGLEHTSVTPPRSSPLDELLTTVDVKGCARNSRVRHEMHGESGDVGGVDHSADRQVRPEVLASSFEPIACSPLTAIAHEFGTQGAKGLHRIGLTTLGPLSRVRSGSPPNQPGMTDRSRGQGGAPHGRTTLTPARTVVGSARLVMAGHQQGVGGTGHLFGRALP
jgi:hypothetical protein